MLKNINKTIELAIYGYKPGEFLPIFIEGKLLNKSEFIRYKLGKGFLKFCDRFEALQEKSKQW